MPTVASPDIQRGFGLTYTGTTITLFLVPGIVGLVVEPIVFLWSDRYPRRWFIAGGLGAMAVSSFVAALAPDATTLAIAISVMWVANGAASALSQATLVDGAPDRRARTMARWTLCALAGDVIAPVALAAIAAIGLGWRAGFALVGVVLAIWCAAVVVRTFDVPQPGDEREPDEPSLWQALRTALRDRTLMLWLFGMALCDLLDEILVVFASLHVRNALGAGIAWQSAILGTFMLGSALGLVLLDRLLKRHSERKLLVVTATACVVAYVAWLLAPALWLSSALMLLVGATSAPLYPLAAARAYARSPGRSGAVLAASHLFTPLGLALPIVLGAVADHAGTLAALALLVIQPFGLAVLATVSRDAPRGP